MSGNRLSTMQGFVHYLSNGVVWALSNGLTADDLGDDVPESIKDDWDELHDQWTSLMHDADNFMDMIECGGAA